MAQIVDNNNNNNNKNKNKIKNNNYKNSSNNDNNNQNNNNIYLSSTVLRWMLHEEMALQFPAPQPQCLTLHLLHIESKANFLE